MPKNVVIVESPAKASTIEKYLGKDFQVLASYGHVRDLPSKSGSVEPEKNFAMHYQVAEGSEKNLKAIATAVKGADAIYLATDLDREGEAISWHVLEELKRRLKEKMDHKKIHRIAFAEITKSAIQNAVAHPRTLNDDLINAQQARRALDYLVGFTLSPVLWRKVRRGLSAGRVQSVALRLICEREDEIDAFKPEEFWTIEAAFHTPQGDAFTAKLHTFDTRKVEKFSFTDEAAATAAVKALQPLDYTLSAVEKKEAKRHPGPPFITSTLQQEASRKLGFSARKTMTTAQRLYEAGYITYMRTDSVNLAQEAIQAIREEISTRYGADYLPEKANYYKSKSQNAQEAHEAIRPTNFAQRGKELKVESDQAKLYDLIWNRAMACQMASARFDQTTLTVEDTAGANIFRATGRILTFPGFLKVYQESGMDIDDSLLPVVTKGDTMDLTDLLPEQHFTEPPPRFSEASLVKALEEYGIGRPSTYASIISTLLARDYVRLEKKRFHPEDVGRIVTKFLAEHFEKYVDYNFTAHMEDDLDAIARGEKQWVPVLDEFWTPFKELTEDKIENVRKRDVTSEDTGETCPSCKQGTLVIRLGRYGRFKGCNAYPECKYTEPLDGQKPTEPKAPPEGTGVTCPKCKVGELVKRTSRRGKIFYSCGTYPTCDYAVWDKPLNEPCPQCSWPVITLKETKRFGNVKKCPQKECGWQDKETVKRKKPAA
jgi:DNA topoisomerase-1